MVCPACKSPLIVVEYRQVELDYCQSCHGVWFDSGELDILLKKVGLEEAKTFLGNVGRLKEVTTAEKRRRCPICNGKMRKERLGGEQGVLVDLCPRWDGLWFDGGEVDHLVKILHGKIPAQAGSEGEVFSFIEEVFKAG